MSDGQVRQVEPAEKPFECFRCGICCTRYQPRLSPEELEGIAAELSLSTTDFIVRYVIVTQTGYLLKQSKGGCIFLQWENGGTRATCGIYPFRPAACRNWTPSLFRPECQEGLIRLPAGNRMALLREAFGSSEAAEGFFSSLRQEE